MAMLASLQIPLDHAVLSALRWQRDDSSVLLGYPRLPPGASLLPRLSFVVCTETETGQGCVLVNLVFFLLSYEHLLVGVNFVQ